MKEDSWVDRYYEALAFYYWEPQHLRKRKGEDANIEQVLKRIRSIEVPLNHILNQFLSLAPSSFRNRVCEQVLGRAVQGEFMLSTGGLDYQRPKWDECQPDFFLIAGNGGETISVEMKIDSKTSVKQVLRYAALALGLEQQPGRENMMHTLIFLGKTSFKSLWDKASRVGSPDDLRVALLRDKDAFFAEHMKNDESLKLRYDEIVTTLAIGFLNYAELAELLNREYELTGASAGDVYSNLLDGMLRELQSRGLVS